ncbi:CdiA family toxin C-terminal domain-containing protein [Bacillus ndiopicus]|uniref:CdiA family toxin C-terminal domain-containing protein n=1 Tax=Bacillus ndiopicus TaxID=1347368 RepID=UPI0005AAAC3D|nr:CdiA family toxin C-terminal domain-containing protein [Bacillus ndiopicus]
MFRGFTLAATSFFASIPAVGKAKSASKSLSKKIAKFKKNNKKKLKKLKKKLKKKIGKVYTKARKLRNNLKKRQLVKRIKKAAKRMALAAKNKQPPKKSKAKETKTQQFIKEFKAASKEATRIYHSINTMEPKKITSKMSLTEQLTTSLWNGGLEYVQKSKGKVDSLADTAVDTVKDTWWMVTNPKEALNNIKTAITHPVETAKAMGQSAQETFEKDYMQGNAYSRSYVEGKAIFGIGAAIVGTKGAGSLTKVGKIPDVPKNNKVPEPNKPALEKDVNQLDKGTGNGVSKHNYSANSKNHLIKPEGVSKTGVSGGHNEKEFFNYLDANGIPYKVEKKEPHPSVPGVQDVYYKIAKQERGVYTNEFKAATHKKTVYDENVFTDEQMYKYGQEAMDNGTEYLTRGGQQVIQGTSNGLKFEGWKNPTTGEIESVYPVLEWKKYSN